MEPDAYWRARTVGKVQPIVGQRPISDCSECLEGLRRDALSERVAGALAGSTRPKHLDRRLEIVRVGGDLGVQEREPQVRAKLGFFGSQPGRDGREDVVHGRQDDVMTLRERSPPLTECRSGVEHRCRCRDRAAVRARDCRPVSMSLGTASTTIDADHMSLHRVGTSSYQGAGLASGVA